MNFFYLPDGRLRSGWRVLLGVLAAISANWLAAGIAGTFAGGSQAGFELAYRPATMLLLIAAYSGLLILADHVHGSPLAAQGLGAAHRGTDCLLGFGIGAALIAVAIGVLAVAGKLSFRVVFSRQALIETGWVVIVLATAAMSEELMFRGYSFQRLIEAVGVIPAVLALSALFGYVHRMNPYASVWSMVNTISVGVLLAVAYLRTRALWLPWGIHLGWNVTLGVIFGLPVSGLNFSTLVKGTARGPQWLTGGSYGLEASIVCTAVIILGFVPVLSLFPRRAVKAPPTVLLEPSEF